MRKRMGVVSVVAGIGLLPWFGLVVGCSSGGADTADGGSDPASDTNDAGANETGANDVGDAGCAPRWRESYTAGGRAKVSIANGTVTLEATPGGIPHTQLRWWAPVNLKGDFDAHVRLLKLVTTDTEARASLVVVTGDGVTVNPVRTYHALVGYIHEPKTPRPPAFFGLEARIESSRKQLAVTPLTAPAILRVQRKGSIVTTTVSVDGAEDMVTLTSDSDRNFYKISLDVEGVARATFDDFVIEGTAMTDDFSCNSIYK